MNFNTVCKKKEMKKLASIKKRSSSFCMCFDSVVFENGLVVGEEGEPPSEEEVKPVLSPMANMMIRDDKDNDVMGSCGRKNKHGRRSFSRYVKALFFETSLTKKMRSKKLGQKLNRNYTNLKYSKPISKSTNDSPSMNEDNHSKRSTSSSTFSPCLCTTSTMNSTSTTATTSRCSSSSVSSNSRLSLSETMENNKQGKVGNGNGFNVGICLFLISLWVLVIWGKVYAIFCTSTWLFFACRWSKFKPVPSENIAVDHHFPEIDTELHKKKVIMEGLLERNHTQKSKSFPLLNYDT